MVAESISARRPAHGRASARRPLLAAVAAIGLFSAPLAGALPASAAASGSLATAADAAGVTLTLAPASGTTLGANQGLTVSVRIENHQTTTLNAGAVQVSLETDTLDDRAALDGWLSGTTDPLAVASATAATASTASIVPGGSLDLLIPVPATAVPKDVDSGPLGLSASLSVATTAVANDRSAVVLQEASLLAPQPLTIVVPITAPARESGLISADSLEEYTAPGGVLSEQLNAVEGRSVTLGVDPAIIASIRILGSTAPEPALAWLARLEASQLPMFALAFADADIAAQAQAGLGGLLAPTGLPIDPELFTDLPALPTTAPDASLDPTSTPAPSAEPTAPTLEELLTWPWTIDAFAWPESGTVAAGDPAVFAAGGYGAMLLGSSNVTDFTPGVSAPRTSVAGVSTLVSDAGASALLGTAASAANDVVWRAATAELAASLALSGENGTVLALPRDGSSSSARLPATLDAIATLPWATPNNLAQALAAPSAAELAIAPMPESAERISLVQRMSAVEAPIAEFSSVLDDPAALRDAVRLDLLALISNEWLPDAAAWTDAGNAFLVRGSEIANAITFSDSSSVNVLATTAEIPITIQNSFSEPVNLVIDVVPTNGRLIVDGDITATIQPGSQSTVFIPVNARIGSGDVTLNASALSPSGVRLATTSVHVNVQADWEGIGALVVAILAVVFFGFGVIRTIRRRRAARLNPEHDSADATAPESQRE